MPNLTKEQIEKLMQGATMNQWIAVTQASTGDLTGEIKQVLIGLPLWPTIATCTRKQDAAFIAALPDIAKTCLDLFARVKEVERQAKADILQARVDERLANLEDVQQLIIRHKASPELMDDLMKMLKNPIGDWNPEIKACSV